MTVSPDVQALQTAADALVAEVDFLASKAANPANGAIDTEDLAAIKAITTELQNSLSSVGGSPSSGTVASGAVGGNIATPIPAQTPTDGGTVAPTPTPPVPETPPDPTPAVPPSQPSDSSSGTTPTP